MSALSLDAAMRAVADAVERELDRLLPRAGEVPAVLADAMRHACLGGGKRLRPFLSVATGRLFGADEQRRLRAGTAVELIHGYSLVHDDLPAMDDAALRRGRPTVHKLFGDANAILAGDALQALAFEVLAGDDWPPPPASGPSWFSASPARPGPRGMCGGQTLDLEAEHQPLDERRHRPPPGAQDRGADRPSRPTPAASWAAPPPRNAGRSAPTPRRSASPSRSATTCSTTRATRPRSARTPAATPPPARPPS